VSFSVLRSRLFSLTFALRRQSAHPLIHPTAYTLTYSDEILSTLPSSVTPIRTLVGTAHSTDAEFARTWYKQLGTWLEEGEFRPMRTTVVPGGLHGVAEGLRRLKEGEVSGEKLVYRIEETEGL